MSATIRIPGAIVAVCLLLAPMAVADSTGTVWNPYGDGPADVLLEAFTFFEGDIVAGGWPGGATSPYVGGIYRWDGSSWQMMGQSTTHVIEDLVVYNGQLIAVAEPVIYAVTDRDTLTCAVAWDGSVWANLGFGPCGDFNAATVWDNKLVVAGNFDTAAGLPAKGVAVWDGANWSALGYGIDGRIYALTVFEGDLIAGGRYLVRGDGLPLNNIARWDGASWQPVGDGFDNDVSVLAVYDGQLTAGGRFSNSGATPIEKVASWNGISWEALGSGPDLWDVVALTEFNGELLAGGEYVMARFDGVEWIPALIPAGARIRAFGIEEGTLIAAGTMGSLGVDLNNIAWRTTFDQDSDGVYDIYDNCIWTVNPDQTDTDSNGVGDICQTCCIEPTVGDVDQNGATDITDIQILVDNQFLTLTPLICDEEADLDFSGDIDVTDLSILIDNQFLTLSPLAPCP